MKEPLFLASNSPRRAKLLTQLGFEFTVCSPQNQEMYLKQGSDDEIVKLANENALQKALSVLPTIEQGIILSGDTLVVTDDNMVLGKPKSPEEALSMLQKLVGRTHRVISAVAVVEVTKKKTRQGHVWAKVTFQHASEQALNEYVLTREPLGKAGGYAIQGKGAFLVKEIEGSYTSVIGLPVELVLSLLSEFGITPHSNSSSRI
ncbi:MAG: Maf family protein [Promethearchaeota archaeon]